jgi:hypothetical protein
MSSYRQEMLDALIVGIDQLRQFQESPEEIAPEFMKWVANVHTALDAAGMREAIELWDAAGDRIRFSADESAFVVHMASMRAVLLAIRDRHETVEPNEQVLDPAVVGEAPAYVRQIAAEVNVCYERGCFNATAVLLRRLVETLIIECFESAEVAERITAGDGLYVGLADLIRETLNCDLFRISRGATGGLQRLTRLKELGDRAAHARRFMATRADIDRVTNDARIVVQELAYIAAAAVARHRRGA